MAPFAEHPEQGLLGCHPLLILIPSSTHSSSYENLFIGKIRIGWNLTSPPRKSRFPLSLGSLWCLCLCSSSYQGTALHLKRKFVERTSSLISLFLSFEYDSAWHVERVNKVNVEWLKGEIITIIVVTKTYIELTVGQEHPRALEVFPFNEFHS